MHKLFSLLKGLLTLSRPFEWTKSLGNMLIAFIVANNSGHFNWFLFAIGFLAVGPFLWSGLYTLNDFTDWQKDKIHPVKKKRPIPNGLISPKQALAFALALIAMAFATGIFVIGKPLFILSLAGMLANQLLYTLKPFELKKKTLIDLVSGSLVNPFFRFYSGWFLVQNEFNAPIELVIFVLGLQFGGYTLYRLASKKHETQLDYKSTIVLIGENKIKTIAYAGIILGCIAFIAAIANNILPPKYLLLAIASLLPLPFYIQALKNPQKMNMEFTYKLLYIHYAAFIAGLAMLTLV